MDINPTQLKEGDWSLSLEDEEYAENRNELFAEALSAINQTKAGRYVNIITPEQCGDPHEWFIPELTNRLTAASKQITEIRFIDMCGCGGYVTRITC
ncbi:CGCGG family rSAM-modified RiPP protein [Anaerobacillus sp. MEB173]|uniref:CGCGG family putative rSAM-modified RiPP protein n=1 Tax=Anaerobacillus sp. MEB173 TaxID=3383345 RepID=UPI003F91EDB2